MPAAGIAEQVPGNPYLGRLLSLQQDGSGAISAPSNWLSKPLLQVETPTLTRVRQFADFVATNDVPHWLVLVGGPGNGKSMAVQALVQRLLEQGLKIQDEAGVSIADMASKPVPAVLDVRRANDELVARIAQDASVVPNPYVAEPNPAADLRDLLARCIKDQCHLVACANRGVLEAAAAMLNPDDGVELSELMQMLVATGQGSDIEELRLDASGVTLTARAMDAGSLFQGDSPVFLQLLDLATAPEHWEVCQACPIAAKCPFQLNRNALASKEGKARVARLCEDGELLDGQPLVFREVGALVSLMLAGCSADYSDETPCHWVARGVNEEAWFRLSARRLHMLLLSAPTPLGIHQPEDLQAIRSLCEAADVSSERVLNEVPSTRVGLSRLLGAKGVMRQLDPLASPVEDGLQVWDDGYIENDVPITELESACQCVWDELDRALGEPRPDIAAGLAALARWRSAHSLRYGALHKGLHTWREELENFREAIGIPARPSLGERNRLTRMLREVLDSVDGIRVASHVRVDGTACGDVGVDWEASYDRRSICITLGETPGVLAQIPAAAFVWLSRRHDAPLHDGTFPEVWLQSAREAIARAASACMYSRAQKGRIRIDGGQARIMELVWDTGEVEAEVVANG